MTESNDNRNETERTALLNDVEELDEEDIVFWDEFTMLINMAWQVSLATVARMCLTVRKQLFLIIIKMRNQTLSFSPSLTHKHQRYYTEREIKQT